MLILHLTPFPPSLHLLILFVLRAQFLPTRAACLEVLLGLESLLFCTCLQVVDHRGPGAGVSSPKDPVYLASFWAPLPPPVSVFHAGVSGWHWCCESRSPWTPTSPSLMNHIDWLSWASWGRGRGLPACPSFPGATSPLLRHGALL